MQTKLTIALVAAAFALASYPAFAADMPVDGTKNFTAPGGAPSYFTNEAVPASARVANQATFTEDEVTAPEVAQPATDRGGKRASARKSTKHASGKSKDSGGSAHYTKPPSKATRSGVAHSPGGRSASSTAGSGKSGTQAGASKANTTKQVKSSIRQQANAIPRAAGATSFA